MIVSTHKKDKMMKLFSLKNKSIYHNLIFKLITVTVLAGLIIAMMSFLYSLRSADKLQDDVLKQMAYFVSANVDIPDVNLYSHDNQIFIQNNTTKSDEKYFIDDLNGYQEGFYTIKHPKSDRRYRVYIKSIDGNNIAVMFDEAEFRDEMIGRSVGLSVLPILLWVLLIMPLVIWLIYQSLAPIHHLANHVKNRTLSHNNSLDLTPLDVTDIPKELQGFVQSINRLLAKIEEDINRQKRFIADASHELRSPMTALSLQAERLHHQLINYINGSRNQSDVIEQAQHLQQSIGRIRHLLEQLLSLAKVQASDNHQDKQIISVLNGYRQVLSDLLPLADDKCIDIGIITQDDIHIHANEYDIYTLIKTLCENAIIYTPIGGQVDLSWQTTATEVILQVEDNGTGIVPTERERVLEPFYRVLGSGQVGTGLGLAIADGIAKRYHGRVVLEDSTRFGQGLSVKVCLPIDIMHKSSQLIEK